MMKMYTPCFRVGIDEVCNCNVTLVNNNSTVYFNYPIYQEYDEGISFVEMLMPGNSTYGDLDLYFVDKCNQY